MKSYSLPELAEELVVSLRTTETWVATGELRAINVSRNPKSRKPRLRVMQSDLDAFLSGRSTNVAAEKRQPRRKRVDVEQFV